MDDLDFGYDNDFSFMDSEDFGLASSFTTAPMGTLSPDIKL